MVRFVSQLTSITSIVYTFVYLPNGEQALVTHIGTVTISSTLILTDVLCVPSFTFNLISVSKLIKSLCCCLIFLGDCYFIQDLAQWSTIGLGKAHNGLFLLQDSGCRSSAFALVAAITSVSSSNLWHSRLGHPSHSKLQLLKQLVHDVNINKIASCCDICHFSKQKKLPFIASTHVSTNPFDLLHCDLWGPFATRTVDGFKFFLTIVDDSTRRTWVYLLKHKSKTQVYLPQFASMVSTQCNCKIKTIRSDNGTKFYLKDFFQSNGTLHQLTCVDTPQQNAVVKRK